MKSSLRVRAWWPRPLGAALVGVLLQLILFEAAAQQAPEPPAAAGERDPNGPLELSLRDCVRLAVRYNPRIRDEALNVIDADTRGNQRAAFIPSVRASATMRRETIGEPFFNAEPRGRFTQTGPVFEAGINGLAPTGTTYSLTARSDLLWTTKNTDIISPQYHNTLAMELRQPLISRWGMATTLSDLRAAEPALRAAEHRASDTGAAVLLDVVRAYWVLFVRHDLLKIQRGGLDYFQQQIERARKARPKNAAAIIRAFEIQLANQQSVIVYSVKDILDAEKSLLDLVYLVEQGRESLPINQRLQPTDKYELAPETRSLPELIAIANDQRPDIRALRADMRAQELRVAAEKNRSRPALDLVLNAGLTSFTGVPTLGDPRHTFVENLPHPQIRGDYLTAWRQVFLGKMPYVEAGLSFSMPFSTLRRTLPYEIAKFNLDRLKLRLATAQSKAAIEVRDAFMQLKVQESALQVAQNAFETAVKRKDQMLEDLFAEKATAADVMWGEEVVGRYIGGYSWAAHQYMILKARLEQALGNIQRYLGLDEKATP